MKMIIWDKVNLSACKPLDAITLGQRKTDYIDQMIAISKKTYFSNKE